MGMRNTKTSRHTTTDTITCEHQKESSSDLENLDDAITWFFHVFRFFKYDVRYINDTSYRASVRIYLLIWCSVVQTTGVPHDTSHHTENRNETENSLWVRWCHDEATLTDMNQYPIRTLQSSQKEKHDIEEVLYLECSCWELDQPRNSSSCGKQLTLRHLCRNPLPIAPNFLELKKAHVTIYTSFATQQRVNNQSAFSLFAISYDLKSFEDKQQSIVITLKRKNRSESIR